VHEPVLVHADVHEGAERRDVGDDPGSFIPGARSSILSTPSVNENASNCWRGSRPGRSNSARMSVSVGRPTARRHSGPGDALAQFVVAQQVRHCAPEIPAMRSTTG